MASKNIYIMGRDFQIEGASSTDVYFSGLSDHTDQDFRRIVQCLLDSDSVAIDIGANIGITSLILNQHLSSGIVYSFEPSPRIFSILEVNLQKNGFDISRARKIAVGSATGRLGFSGESAYGHLVVDQKDRLGGEVIDVDVETLDNLIDSYELERLDFIKIDVEGFEADVLTGGVKTEEKYQPLYYMEFNSWTLLAFRKMNPLDFIELILENFKYVFHVGKSGNLTRINKNDSLTLLYQNFVQDSVVSNLLMTNSESRVRPEKIQSISLLIEDERKASEGIAEKDIVTQERDTLLEQLETATAERDAALSSLKVAWRDPIPHLFRAYKRKLGSSKRKRLRE